MFSEALQLIYRLVVVAKILHASSAAVRSEKTAMRPFVRSLCTFIIIIIIIIMPSGV